MSFKEVLEGYMQDRNEDVDLAFMENIVKEHDSELESAKTQASQEMETAWKEKYKKAFFHGDEKEESRNNRVDSDPNRYSIDDLMGCFK